MPWEDCITAVGKLTLRGYGQKKQNGKTKWAHRWAWINQYGPIPSSVVIRHKCDNPACVNIEHLEPGSQWDNVQDCIKRGRFVKPRIGENHPMHKLTDEQVKDIRQSPLLQRTLAKKYQVHPGTISKIKGGTRRAH